MSLTARTCHRHRNGSEMFDSSAALALLVILLALVAAGVDIAVALGIGSIVGVYLLTDDFGVVLALLGSTAHEALRDYVFAAIPLFMLLGEFIRKAGVVTDVYAGLQRIMPLVPGRLALATVQGNALFSFVTGVSIASAAAFTRIAYPEMRRHGYDRAYAVGSIAGSSCLGMLIPPSVLMIIWGLLTEESIGRIFIAGVVPGLLLAALMSLYVVGAAVARPKLAGAEGAPQPPPDKATDSAEIGSGSVLASTLSIFALMGAVLGGIWTGFFTPTEAAGAGAFLALAIGIAHGMRGAEILEAILSVGRTSAPILLLLLSAALYSRALAMTGLGNAIQDFFAVLDAPGWVVLAGMMGVWLLLGAVIDSISIMLLTVPIFVPIAETLGFEPISFAIVGILSIEAGLLTPPFGLLVYTVKASIEADDVSVSHIFRGAAPYWVILLAGAGLVAAFPVIATGLVDLAF